MSILVCSVCGHISFEAIETMCPVCQSSPDKFDQNDTVFEDSAAKSKEAAVKHKPQVIINKKCDLIPELPCTDVIVRIGATLHPMEESHFIQFIDCYLDAKFISRIYLTSEVIAAGCFHCKSSGSKVTIVEKCNLHGYWMTENVI